MYGQFDARKLEQQLAAIEGMALAKQMMGSASREVDVSSLVQMRVKELEAVSRSLDATFAGADQSEQMVRGGGSSRLAKLLSMGGLSMVSKLCEYTDLSKKRDEAANILSVKRGLASMAGMIIDPVAVDTEVLQGMQSAAKNAVNVCDQAHELLPLTRAIERVEELLRIKKDMAERSGELKGFEQMNDQDAQMSAESLRDKARKLREVKVRAESQGIVRGREIDVLNKRLSGVEASANLKEAIHAAVVDKPTTPDCSLAELRVMETERYALLGAAQDLSQADSEEILGQSIQHTKWLIEAKETAAICTEEINLASRSLSSDELIELHQKAIGAQESKKWSEQAAALEYRDASIPSTENSSRKKTARIGKLAARKGDGSLHTISSLPESTFPSGESITSPELTELSVAITLMEAKIDAKDRLKKLGSETPDPSQTPDELHDLASRLASAWQRAQLSINDNGKPLDLYGGKEANDIACRLGDVQALIALKEELRAVVALPASIEMPVRKLRTLLGSQLHPLLERSRRYDMESTQEYVDAQKHFEFIKQLIATKERIGAVINAALAQRKDACGARVRQVLEQLQMVREEALTVQAHSSTPDNQAPESDRIVSEIGRLKTLVEAKDNLVRVAGLLRDFNFAEPNDRLRGLADSIRASIKEAEKVDAAGGVELHTCELQLTKVETMIDLRDEMRFAAVLTKPARRERGGEARGNATALPGSSPLLLHETSDTLCELITHIRTLLDQSVNLGMAACEESKALEAHLSKVEQAFSAKEAAKAATLAVAELGKWAAAHSSASAPAFEIGGAPLELVQEALQRAEGAREALLRAVSETNEFNEPALDKLIIRLQRLVEVKQAAYDSTDEVLGTASEAEVERRERLLKIAYDDAKAAGGLDVGLAAAITRRLKQLEKIRTISVEVAQKLQLPCDPVAQTPRELLEHARDEWGPLLAKLQAVMVEAKAAPEASKLEQLVESAKTHAASKAELAQMVQYSKQALNNNVPSRLLKKDLDRMRAAVRRLSAQGNYQDTPEMKEVDKEDQRISKILEGLGHVADARPTYWAPVPSAGPSQAAPTSKDKFKLVPIESSSPVHRSLCSIMKNVDVTQLGVGRDTDPAWRDKKYKLELATAWRIEHDMLWDKYNSAKRQVKADMDILAEPQNINGFQHKRVRGLTDEELKTASAAGGLPGPLDDEVNERILLHGTRPETLLKVLSQGLNERFCSTGGLFGAGTYLAEDAGKNDQYTKVDLQHDSSGSLKDLHSRLYSQVDHPQEVYYIFVCRAAMGYPIRTKDGTSCMDDPQIRNVFGTRDKRELVDVPDVSPPVKYHSLICELGGQLQRYREFMIYHSEYIYPEYLMAYWRKPR